MKTFLTALLSITGFLLSILWDGMLLLFDLFDRPKGHDAKFGHYYQLGNRFNSGFLFGRNARLTKRSSYENMLIVGGTGSGKTSNFLIRNLLKMRNMSWIINDPSKELYLKCSGFLRLFFDIKILNPSDSLMSCGYNILSRVKTITDIQQLASMLTRTALFSGGADPYWLIKSTECIVILIRLTLYQSSEYKNMANVLNLLNHLIASPEIVDELIVKTNDNNLILEYKALVATSDKTLQSVLSSAKASLQVFLDPQVACVTTHDSICFETLRKKPTIIFLHSSIAKQEYYKSLNSIIMQQFYEYVLETLPKNNDLDIFILLEEASSFYVPLLPLALANCRKYRVGTIVALQSVGQLEKLYSKDAQNIVNNCITKIYLPGLTSTDTRELENLSGKATYKDHKGIEKTISLITVDKARIIHKNRTFILHSNMPIIKGRSLAYYRSASDRACCKIPPMELKGDIPDEPIALLTDCVSIKMTKEEVL